MKILENISTQKIQLDIIHSSAGVLMAFALKYFLGTLDYAWYFVLLMGIGLYVLVNYVKDGVPSILERTGKIFSGMLVSIGVYEYIAQTYQFQWVLFLFIGLALYLFAEEIVEVLPWTQ